MRVLLTRDVPPVVIMATLKTKENYSMKILQPSLLLPPPESTAKIMMKIMTIHFTLVPLNTCQRIENLSYKSPTKACEQLSQKSFFKILTQSNLLN